MAITTLANYNAAFPGQSYTVHKTATGPGPVTGGLSFWTSATLPPGAVYPAAATTWTVLTSQSPGAIPFTNPQTGNSYLGKLATFPISTPNSHCVLYDRLAQTGVITPAASTQSLTTTPLTRPNALGDNVELWWEGTAAFSGTATFSCSYTNQDGVSERTTENMTALTSGPVGSMEVFSLQAGDTGVRSVESFTSTASASNGILVLLRRIATSAVYASNPLSPLPLVHDGFALGLPRIYDNACLALMGGFFSNQAQTTRAQINIIQE